MNADDPNQKRYQCPLCRSQLSRDVYEQVLRIRETRDKEFSKERDALVARMKAIQSSSAESQRRAAESARKKAEAEARGTLAATEQQLRALKDRSAQEQRRFQRELSAAIRRAHVDARSSVATNIRRKDAQHRQALAKCNASIASLTKQLVDQQKEAKRRIATSERAARQVAEERSRRTIDRLQNDLKVIEERRKRDEADWKRTAEELKRKADGHDRGHFGPEGEEQLVAVLVAEFPGDQVEHHGKGGDVIHTVHHAGRPIGKIVYECKQTSKWNKAFTRQLKDAMTKHETRHGLLVSRVLPPRTSGFVSTNGVLAVEPHLAASLAGILRRAVVELAQAKLTEQGKAAKTTELYEYLRSDDFANAIRRIKDKVQELRGTLEKEKAHHETWWNTREQHYAAVLRETMGIDGRVGDILSAPRSSAPRRPVPIKLERVPA